MSHAFSGAWLLRFALLSFAVLFLTSGQFAMAQETGGGAFNNPPGTGPGVPEQPATPPPTPGQSELFEQEANERSSSEDFFDQDANQVARDLYEQCWGCTIFDVFMVKGVQSANQVSASMHGEMLAVLGIITVCYMMLKIGGGLIVGDASDLPTRFFSAYKMGIVAAIAAAFLQAGGGGAGGAAANNVWTYVVGPVLDVPLGASLKIMQQAGVSAQGCGAGGVNAGNPVGDATLGTMRSMICMMHKATAKGMGQAWAFVKTGTGIFDALARFFIGVFMIGCFAWTALTFPARFIDAFIRLMIVILLSPAFVVCAAFKHTRNYAVIALKNVLYAGMLTLFMSFMFVIAVGVIGAVGEFNPSAVNNSQAMMNYAVAPIGVVADVGNVVLSLPYYLFAIGVTLIINTIIAQGPALAQQFSEVSVGTGVGDRAMQAMGSMISLPVKGAAAGAGAAMAQRAIQTSVAQGVVSGSGRGLGVGG